ncbi:hypothetical protein CALCODRAFT_78794 [Calocera cornea HHB12733]|uniref:Uncharacterized protein n=1 Tax=Calocera cornea HHB12733 TaxID=1353952 RepID=A0A165DG47_9BASI|nr:hypothetical protein CALCODRAFT_78794 [Calocera cornea HHB12733]
MVSPPPERADYASSPPTPRLSVLYSTLPSSSSPLCPSRCSCSDTLPPSPAVSHTQLRMPVSDPSSRVTALLAEEPAVYAHASRARLLGTVLALTSPLHPAMGGLMHGLLPALSSPLLLRTSQHVWSLPSGVYCTSGQLFMPGLHLISPFLWTVSFISRALSASVLHQPSHSGETARASASLVGLAGDDGQSLRMVSRCLQ